MLSNMLRLASFHRRQLQRLNLWLEQQDLPPYWLGGTNFNEIYRLYPSPRFVWWRLNRIYLIYKPNSPDERKLTYKV